MKLNTCLLPSLYYSQDYMTNFNTHTHVYCNTIFFYSVHYF